MDFQRYYDGVGLIVENKINNSFSTCPLCGEMKVDWEIVFDFKGELICVLAKCPHCGGVIKTIFNFNNGENPTSFTVSDTGETNRNSLVQGVNYTLPSANRGAKSQNVSATQSQQTDSEGSTVGWGILGFFIPIVGFILWLIWKDEHPARAKSAGIGCLVSICLGVVGVILYVVLVFVILGIGVGAYASMLPLLATLI
ncbi:MAG: PLDc N-terminal domain-containing protein [Christensenellales bacterium]